MEKEERMIKVNIKRYSKDKMLIFLRKEERERTGARRERRAKKGEKAKREKGNQKRLWERSSSSYVLTCKSYELLIKWWT